MCEQSELQAAGVLVPPSTPVVGSAVSAARELRALPGSTLGDTSFMDAPLPAATSAWAPSQAYGGFGGTNATTSAGSGYRHLRRASAARAPSVDGYGGDDDRSRAVLLGAGASVADTADDDDGSEWSFIV